jgi:hypothetical protein
MLTDLAYDYLGVKPLRPRSAQLDLLGQLPDAADDGEEAP